MREFRPQEILRTLHQEEVEFIIIGGIAGAFHQVGLVTEDLDVVVAATAENRRRLIQALEKLDARFVMLNPAQIIRPTLERIRGMTGPMLFETRFGRLDVLQEAGGHRYETLIKDGIVGSVENADAQVASLKSLVEMKRAANRPKDRLVLPMLEQALEKLRGTES